MTDITPGKLRLAGLMLGQELLFDAADRIESSEAKLKRAWVALRKEAITTYGPDSTSCSVCNGNWPRNGKPKHRLVTLPGDSAPGPCPCEDV